MFLDIAILITSTFAFVVWVAVLILYIKKNRQLKEEIKRKEREEYIRSIGSIAEERLKRLKAQELEVRELQAREDIIIYLKENDIEPISFHGLYHPTQLFWAKIQIEKENKKPNGGKE